MHSSLFALRGTAIVMSLFLLFTLGMNTNCSKEPTPYLIDDNGASILLKALRAQNCDSFKQMVNSLQVTNQVSIPEGVQISPGAPETTVEGYERCTSQQFSASAGYSEQSVMDPTTNVVYTGALVDGDSWSTGAYRTLVADRAPLNISISTQTNGSPKEIVQHPEQVSSFREALNSLLMRSTFSGPAYVNFKIDSIYSEDQARMLTGAKFSGWGAKVSGNYNYGSSSTKSMLLVKFIQKYFTIDMDDPQEPCSLFDTLPDLHDFGTSPMYISSVAYGRVAYMMISSSHRLDSLAWAINASYKGYGANAEASVHSDAKKIMDQSSMSGFIVGGSGDAAVKSIEGFNGLKDFLTGGGNPSPTSPGAPIAYTLKYLKNREVAKVQLSSTYLVRNCETIGQLDTVYPTNNNDHGYNYCGSNTHGDHEFDFNGPYVKGTFELIQRGINEVWCAVDVTWTETNPHDGSKAEAHDTLHLYTAPPGMALAAFPDNSKAYFEYTDDNFDPDNPGLTGADFIEALKVVGDTSGDDMECNEDKDCHVFFRIKPFRISLKHL